MRNLKKKHTVMEGAIGQAENTKRAHPPHLYNEIRMFQHKVLLFF